jgi:flagellar hook-associated protein 2
MGLQLSGLASGFDWKSLVDQLIEANRTPAKRMQAEQRQNDAKTAALNEVKGLLSTLKSSITPLSSTEAIQKKAATFKDTATKWSASATSDATPGTYEFKLVTEAKAAKLSGDAGISKTLVPNDIISNLSVGRTITGGYITINGKQIPISTTSRLDYEPNPLDPLDSPGIIQQINSAGIGVTAAYIDDPLDEDFDKIKLTGVTSLGASNDTSNFLQAMRLSGFGDVKSSAALSSPNLNVKIDSANLMGWLGTGVSDEIKINGAIIEYNSSSDTLQSLLNKINSSAADVTATYDSSQGKFILTNKSTGNVGITVSDGMGMGMGGLAEAMGLTTGTTLLPGSDAVFSVNGVSGYTSRSNTLDESVHRITGLTVIARYDSVTEANNTQTITVGSDTSGFKDALNTFITNYNNVQNVIDKYTKVTVNGKKVTSAILSGSTELASISRDLRRMLYVAGMDSTGITQLTGAVKRLSDMGVGSTGLENTISLTNSSILDSKLTSNPSDVIDYFATATYGLSARLDTMLGKLVNDKTTDATTGNIITGTFKVKLDSLSKQNTSLDKQIADLEQRLTSQRALLEASFIAMEKAQSGFQQQSSYLQRTFSGKN